ncbi:hypothetical protein DFH09DRAFT_1097073, partial [Mycena vulgaris]
CVVPAGSGACAWASARGRASVRGRPVLPAAAWESRRCPESSAADVKRRITDALRGDRRQARVASVHALLFLPSLSITVLTPSTGRRCALATEGIERELGNARRTRAPGIRMRVAEDEEEECASACGYKECQGAARRRGEEGSMYMQRDLLLRGGVPLELNVEHSSLTRRNWDFDPFLCPAFRPARISPTDVRQQARIAEHHREWSKYVSSAVKTVVLKEMTVICNSQDNYDLDFLLKSRNEEVQGWTCLHKIIDSELAMKMTSSERSRHPHCYGPPTILTASRLVAAPFLDRVTELLESPNTAIRVRMSNGAGCLGGKCLRTTRIPVAAAMEANLHDHVTELLNHCYGVYKRDSDSLQRHVGHPCRGNALQTVGYHFCRYAEWTICDRGTALDLQIPDGPGAVVEANIMEFGEKSSGLTL